MKRRSPVPWILLAVGLALAAGGVFFGVARAWSSFQSVAIWSTPGSEQVQLDAGDWTVYELVGAATSSGRVPPRENLVDQGSITVSGPQGEVPVVCVSCGVSSETMTLNNDSYLGIVRFTAPVSGEYTITVTSRGSQVMLAPPVTAAIGAVFTAIGLVGLGMLLVFVSVIWLLVRLVNGRKSAAPVSAPPPNAAAAGVGIDRGWYPDPGNPQQLRWWDGSQWTEHSRPVQ